MAEKPAVQFGRIIGWKDRYNGAVSVSLGEKTGHPILGPQRVIHTSRVERIAYNENNEPVEIETKNTIYRRAG